MREAIRRSAESSVMRKKYQEIPFHLQRFGTKPKSKIKKQKSSTKSRTRQKGREAGGIPSDTIQAESVTSKRMAKTSGGERSASISSKGPAPSTKDGKSKIRPPKKSTTKSGPTEDSKLHPSWRLKRQQAEKEKLLLTRVSKRVHKKFDESSLEEGSK